VNLDAQTAGRIGANWLRAALAPAGDFGRRADDAARPYGPGDAEAAQARCAQIAALAERLTLAGVARLRATLRRGPDPAGIVSRATLGDALDDVDFFEIGRFAEALDAAAQAWDAAGGTAAERPPVVPEVRALLGRGLEGGGFYLTDAFSAALGAAREALATADADFVRERRRLASALEARLGTLADGEEFIVMRDAVPGVPPGARVVRETPGYRVLALEFDASAVVAAQRRDDALARVAREEDAVRRELAAGVARAGSRLLEAARFLGELDRTLARVAFTQRWGGCVPDLGGRRFAFSQASFVPLRAAREEAGLPYTPISIELADVAILTGPNMGGKSAALATCGFLAACVTVGLPPPATQATLPMVGSIAWVGGEPAAGSDRLLSAFGAEVVRTRDALAAAVAPALLLVDEFARATGPREGRALLVALVEALARRGVFALAATHFDGIARDAGVAHLTIAGLGRHALDAHAAPDVRAALETIAAAMDYRIVPAEPNARPVSDALAVAGLLGLDAGIVARAGELFAAGPLDRMPEEGPPWTR
jgi:DNA mismatch repair protein MutS2